MKRILITSGPTREYLDPVRFLTNGSSGRMGRALAEAALESGYRVVVVSGPISLGYAKEAEVHWVETTEEMQSRCLDLFPSCDGVIGAAAPCDFRPIEFSEQKLSKMELDGERSFRFVSTPDILASLGQIKRPDQWIVGFALETENGREHAFEKLKRKNCDLIALNSPASINNRQASLQIFDDQGRLRDMFSGEKHEVAVWLLKQIEFMKTTKRQ